MRRGPAGTGADTARRKPSRRALQLGFFSGALTVSGGACGVAEGGRITAGPVSVLAGATLFGHGQMGGPVSVASNGWLQAGTAAACGTLAVGGDLTFAPGACIAAR